ncbi:MAG: BatA domain-containing protein, partial [Calditrichaeota bacterium]|nr:BatA domain-containing protein [Calditrichota bacterium]
MFRFANPEYLFLLLLLPLIAIYYWRKRMNGQVNFSSLRHIKKLPKTIRQVLGNYLYWL